ncbi:hypothetical protein SHIRM173S_12967 [Streptomyces hirsutus]
MSSPGNGSTAATSFSPKRSRSASWPAPGPGGQLVEVGGDSAQQAVGRRVLRVRDLHAVPGVPVQRLPLPRGLEQALLVGLPVYGDQLVREFGEDPHRHDAAEVGPVDILRRRKRYG